jgi:hypothetical protein
MSMPRALARGSIAVTISATGGTMRRLAALSLCLFAFALPTVSLAVEQPPISLHPDNPHYFLFRGKPAALVTSGEHYGAVLNGDFDYARYLDELKAHGLNLTRTFSGVYREVPGSFNIKGNTLAPKDAAYVSPWARSGDKYDLNKWNDDYFKRMKDFVKSAGERGVVVELVLFCTFYEDRLWDICPLNQKNNVNGVGKVGREQAHTLREKELNDAQLAFVRKVVSELNGFDNLYYEVCNEPYFAGVADDWQRLVARTVVEAEKGLPHKHLIARNIANGSQKVENPDPNVSIFNFHYANPPHAVTENYDLNKAISYDETGFRGSGDTVYRVHAWEFLLAGGAVYDNLDYSFTADTEDGTAKVAPPTPGGGGRTLRSQLRVLAEFVRGFDFVRMKPDNAVVKSVPDGVAVHALGEPAKQYAVYFARVVAEKGPDGKETGRFSDPQNFKAADVTLVLPDGGYTLEWVDPRSGRTLRSDTHEGGEARLRTPEFTEDLALRVRRANN